MYHQCRLVHADLSEYNILYHDSHLYVIDVSQSVEHDHPAAFDFLRKDLKNVEEFFGRFGVKCLGLRRCFEFVTKEKLGESGIADSVVLKQWLEEEVNPEDDDSDVTYAEDESSHHGKAHEDSVFLQSYIPRTLNEVYDPERDVETLRKDGGKGLIYADTIGLVDPSDNQTDKKAGVYFANSEKQDAEGSGESDSDDEEDGESEGSRDAENGKAFEERTPRGHRHEDREAKKVCVFLVSDSVKSI